MKLILAIVSNDDSGAVSSALTRGGFSVTKLATTGGLLMAGHTPLLSRGAARLPFPAPPAAPRCSPEDGRKDALGERMAR